MFCTKCGVQLKDEDKFCAQCGQATSRAEPPSASRRLTRSMRDKKIAGVCSGFARYLDVDIVLVRVIWLTLALATGMGFIGYLIAWIVMPKDYEYYPTAAAQPVGPPHPAS